VETDEVHRRWRDRLATWTDSARPVRHSHSTHDVGAADRTWPPELWGEVDHLTLTVAGVDGLVRALLLSAGRTRVTSLRLVVHPWRPLTQGWSPPGVALPGQRAARAEVDAERHELVLEYGFGAGCDLGRVLLAALRAARPHRADPGPGTPVVALRCPTTVAAAPFLSRVTDLVLPGEEVDDHVRRTDLLLVDQAESGRGVDALDVLVVGGGARRAGGPVVDPAVHNPIGRNGRDRGARTVLEADAHGVRLRESPTRGGEPRTWRLPHGDGLDGSDVRSLLTVDSCDASGVGVDASVERLLVQISASGVVVASAGAGAGGVHPQLRALWAAPLPSGDDPLASTVASVAQRRLALALHGSDAVIRAAGGAGTPGVSVLLLTMRQDRIDHALDQLAGIVYPDLQVVIGLHGDAFDAARTARGAAARLPDRDVVVVEIPGSESFGGALGRLSARADGTLLTKIDDDDYYGPQHVWDLVTARDYSGAAVVGKPPEYVYLAPLDVTVHRPGFAAERYGRFVAGGTMMIARADLDSVGGWRPVPRSVDRGLLDRVIAGGGQVYATHGLGYLYVRHGDGHTWNPGTAHFLRRTEQQWPGLLRHSEFGTGDGGGRVTGRWPPR
jgi:hypothetical protein